MNHLKLGFCAITLFGPGSVEAQSQWCGYEPRSLNDVVQDATSAMPNSEFAFAAYQKPSRAWLQYTGDQRPIGDTLRNYLVNYFRFFQQEPGFDQLYQRQFLFREGDVEYWIPVQEMMVPQFTSELQQDDSTQVFALWAGAYRSGQKWEWVFLIREFSSAATADFWRAELAKCIVPGANTITVPSDSVAPGAWVRQPPARGRSRDELAALVDTLVVAPDTVFLRVGDTYPLFNLSITALDSIGNVINGILPSFTVESSDAVVSEQLVLRGVQPGASRVLVKVESAQSQRGATAAAQVVVVVQP